MFVCLFVCLFVLKDVREREREIVLGSIHRLIFYCLTRSGDAIAITEPSRPVTRAAKLIF